MLVPDLPFSSDCTFVLAVRNTFIEVNEGRKHRTPRRHSLPPKLRMRRSESPCTSGCEGDQSDYCAEECPQPALTSESELNCEEYPRVQPAQLRGVSESMRGVSESAALNCEDPSFCEDFRELLLGEDARDALEEPIPIAENEFEAAGDEDCALMRWERGEAEVEQPVVRQQRSDFESSYSLAEAARDAAEELSTDASFRTDSERCVKGQSFDDPYFPGMEPGFLTFRVSRLQEIDGSPLGQGHAEGPPKGISFHQEVYALSEEVAEVLRQHACAPAMHLSVATNVEEGATTVMVMIPLEYEERAEELVGLAQEALFSKANRSRGVCMLGYKRAPFTITENGFIAKFGSVSRKRQACRQFYANGFCRHDTTCWWHHPETISSVHFVIEICA